MSIQGQLLEVRVTGCRKLRDTEFFSRQDPYVCIEYANTKLRTRTCTDGGRNPTFDDKFHIPLIEGLRELNIVVWNSNTLSHDDFIGSGRVQLQKVLTRGYDDASWPLQTRHMRSAGEVTLIMHFDVSAVNKIGKISATPTTHSVPPVPVPVPMPVPAAMPYTAPPAGYPAVPPYQAYPTSHAHSPYPAPAYSYPLQVREHTAYPPPTTYPPGPPQPYGEPYPPPPQHGQLYPPQKQHEQPYPPQPYGQPYPPPTEGPPTYPPAPFPGTYPPAPY